jgi:site-specific recombinase XerD
VLFVIDYFDNKVSRTPGESSGAPTNWTPPVPTPLLAPIASSNVQMAHLPLPPCVELCRFQLLNDNASSALSSLLEHIDSAYAPKTNRAYKTNMEEFIRYCARENCCALPAEPVVVARFLQQTLSQNIKSATINREASSISAIHRLSCLNDPTKHPEVKIILRKVFRQQGRRFDQAFSITRQILEIMLAVCSEDLHGLRDKALLLLAYDSMRRRSELIALRVEDMELTSNDQACILLRKSKMDQQGSGKLIHLSRETSKSVEDW